MYLTGPAKKPSRRCIRHPAVLQKHWKKSGGDGRQDHLAVKASLFCRRKWIVLEFTREEIEALAEKARENGVI